MVAGKKITSEYALCMLHTIRIKATVGTQK